VGKEGCGARLCSRGLLERRFFRDVDIAVWLEDPREALHYVIYFSAELEAEVKLPADVQVLNEAPSPQFTW